MKRAVYAKLLAWKSNQRRKPLLLQGARQVGKTYIIEAFGKNEYTTFVKFNFEQNPALGELFKKISSQDTLIFLTKYKLFRKF